MTVASAVIMLASCGGAGKNKPGHAYMPDMGVSTAFETYILHDSTKVTIDPTKRGGSAFFYDESTVPGTIRIGDELPYTLPNDSTGYRLSATVENPLLDMSIMEMPEAKRIYQVNCAICHGDKATGNGPLGESGKIGGIANLTLPIYVEMKDGTMFHSITYGKGVMGSYASQLDRRERWMVINYIRSLQPTP